MQKRTTRSSTLSVAQQPAVNGRSSSPAEDSVSALESHLAKVLQAAREGYAKLRQQNEQLAAELADTKDELEGEAQPKRASKGKGPNVSHLQKKIVELEGKVRELEKSRAKDKRKIAKLEAKEIKRDAEELQDQAEFEVGDSADIMRKLLRRFHDLMLANSLGDSEECPVCMTVMEVGEATSLPCQHVFCTECIQQYIAARSHEDEGGKAVPCPSCREMANIKDMEVVEYTSATQWDALLEVANAAAKSDRRRGELDTSDEEEEEAAANTFIDDEQSEHASTVLTDVEENEEVRQDESILSSPLHISSPSKGKQRLLRVQTPQSQNEQPAASGSGTDSTLTNLDEAPEEGGNEENNSHSLSSTPRRPAHSTTPSFLQSPISERRRRLEQLADERQARAKRRRFS
ncbi:hypothetical protein BC835DRAFT_267721 [Cytidiella melzeri]|nr:hypothetical protein BC835DRAFT_267721 [Cytidiella melzeri]